MKAQNEQAIGQIVAQDYRAAAVFREFGLDFCCGGNKTIGEATIAKNVNAEEVKNALQSLDSSIRKEHNYNEWSLDFLVDYIINNHHEYCRSTLPEINFYAKKVLGAHGDDHPELEEVYYELVKLYSEMIQHLDDEEAVLFPYIRKLVEANKNIEMPKASGFGMAAHPISMMEEEHEEAGEAMAKIRRLGDDFTLPDDACATYRVLYENLEAFEKDLHKHVHLENNILFPKALKLERELSTNANI